MSGSDLVQFAAIGRREHKNGFAAGPATYSLVPSALTAHPSGFFMPESLMVEATVKPVEINNRN